jgi:hypothetical protein
MTVLFLCALFPPRRFAIPAKEQYGRSTGVGSREDQLAGVRVKIE